jgi:hypothetical protein
LPFPGLNYPYRLGHQNIPAIPAFGTENQNSNLSFCRKIEKEWKEKGEVETREMILRW